MSLNTFFDAIYCLTLPHRKEDRWEGNCLPLFEREGIVGVVPIYGTYGRDYDFGDANDQINQHRRAEIGCALGHIRCLKEARQNKIKKVLILEDDVQMIEGISDKFDQILDQIPPYDMLYFGGNHVGGKILVSENVYRLRHSYSLQMYSVSEESYDVLIGYLDDCVNYCLTRPLEALKKWPNSWGVDLFIAQIQETMDCYSIRPNDPEGRNFSWQLDDSYSDIQFGKVTYDCLKKPNGL